MPLQKGINKDSQSQKLHSISNSVSSLELIKEVGKVINLIRTPSAKADDAELSNLNLLVDDNTSHVVLEHQYSILMFLNDVFLYMFGGGVCLMLAQPYWSWV